MLAPAALAVATLAVTLFFWVPRGSAPNPEAFPADDTLRSRRVEVMSPIGRLGEMPHELHWRTVKQATRYRVRLFEVDNTELWNGVVTIAKAELPPDVQRKIVPLKTLEWQVTALNAAGVVIAESGPQKFRLEVTRSH